MFPDTRIIRFSGQANISETLLSGQRRGFQFELLSKTDTPSQSLLNGVEIFDMVNQRPPAHVNPKTSSSNRPARLMSLATLSCRLCYIVHSRRSGKGIEFLYAQQHYGRVNRF